MENSKNIILNNIEYAPVAKKEGERPIVTICGERGVTYVGYCDLKRDANGFFTLREAQNVIKWWTGAHLNYLQNGVCEGVVLGAVATELKVSNMESYYEINFDTIEEWKNEKLPKGTKEVL